MKWAASQAALAIIWSYCLSKFNSIHEYWRNEAKHRVNIIFYFFFIPIGFNLLYAILLLLEFDNPKLSTCSALLLHTGLRAYL
jgi:hypothetical protein